MISNSESGNHKNKDVTIKDPSQTAQSDGVQTGVGKRELPKNSSILSLGEVPSRLPPTQAFLDFDTYSQVFGEAHGQ